jgi:hypothetical protein
MTVTFVQLSVDARARIAGDLCVVLLLNQSDRSHRPRRMPSTLNGYLNKRGPIALLFGFQGVISDVVALLHPLEKGTQRNNTQ